MGEGSGIIGQCYKSHSQTITQVINIHDVLINLLLLLLLFIIITGHCMNKRYYLKVKWEEILMEI